MGEPAELERAIVAFAQAPNGGLIVTNNPRAQAQRDLIIGLAARHRLPTVYPARFYVNVGGLISYGIDPADPYRRAAVLGNAGTLMVFRVSANDAEILAPEFHPLPAHELVDQSPYRAWLRRSDSGHRAVFVSPRQFGSNKRLKTVIAQSRRSFGRKRKLIERSFGGNNKSAGRGTRLLSTL